MAVIPYLLTDYSEEGNVQGGKNCRSSNCRLYSPPSNRKPHLWPRHLLAPCLRPSLSTRCRSVPVKDLGYGSSPFSSHVFSSPAAQEAGGAFCEADRLEAGQCLRAERGTSGSVAGNVQRTSVRQGMREEGWIHRARTHNSRKPGPILFPTQKSLCRFRATSPARDPLGSSSQPLHLTHSPVCTAMRSSSLLLLRSLELVLVHVSLSIYIHLQEYRKKLACSFKWKNTYLFYKAVWNIL